MFDLNTFSKEVHQNAVDHGWWDSERTVSELVALIHSEWSEALEEYRANRPMIWYRCGHIAADKICDYGYGNGGCDLYCTDDCERLRGKPEGIAVELIDGCIRILDFVGSFEADLTDADFEKQVDDFENRICDVPLPRLISTAHLKTSQAFALFLGMYTEPEPEEGLTTLIALCFAICGWVKHQGLDPIELLREKHEYNKTRPYKHGGKVI